MGIECGEDGFDKTAARVEAERVAVFPRKEAAAQDVEGCSSWYFAGN